MGRDDRVVRDNNRLYRIYRELKSRTGLWKEITIEVGQAADCR